MSSNLFVEKCTYFNVENRTECIHFPLFCQFTLKMKEISCNNVNYNTYTFNRFSRKYTRFVWSDDKSAAFLQKFKNLHEQSKVHICVTAKEDIDSCIEMTLSMFYIVAEPTKTKRGRYATYHNKQPL